MTMTNLEIVTANLAANGHGHIVQRTDGSRMRCGGRGLCRQCNQEFAEYSSVCTPNMPAVSKKAAELTKQKTWLYSQYYAHNLVLTPGWEPFAATFNPLDGNTTIHCRMLFD